MLKLKTLEEVEPIGILTENPNNTIFEIAYGPTIECDSGFFSQKTKLIVRKWEIQTAKTIYIKVTLHPPKKKYQYDKDEEIKPIKVRIEFNYIEPLKVIKVETKKKENILDTERLKQIVNEGVKDQTITEFLEDLEVFPLRKQQYLQMIARIKSRKNQ